MSNIAQNTSYFTLALVVQKAITFSYFAILARNLDPDYLGKYYLAISLTTMFSVIIDIGLSNLLTREVAKVNSTAPYSSPCQGEVVRRLADRRGGGVDGDGGDISSPLLTRRGGRGEVRAQHLLSTVMAIKLPLAVLALAAVFAAVNLLGYPEIVRRLAYISAIPMLLDSFTASFFAVVRGFHNLKYESAASVMYMAVAMFIGLIFLRRGWGLEWVMSALAFASAFYFLYALGTLYFRYGLLPRPDWRSKLIKAYFLLTIPFGLYALLQRAFTYADTLILSKLAGDWETGLYQVAFKITLALQFLPMAFIASLYPAFAAYWEKKENSPLSNLTPDPSPGPHFAKATRGKQERGASGSDRGRGQEGVVPQIVITFERALAYLALISLPIAAGVIALADSIIAVFKPEYAAAAAPLRIAMVSLYLLFANYPVGALLNACDRQAANTRNMALTLGVSISFNFFLIPMYGAAGAALSVFIANLSMFVLGLRQARRIIPLRAGKLISPFLRSLASAMIMGIIVWYAKGFLHILLLIPLGGLAYSALAVMLKALRTEDIRSIGKTFTNSE